jgi:hypothetical protein
MPENLSGMSETAGREFRGGAPSFTEKVNREFRQAMILERCPHTRFQPVARPQLQIFL